MPRETRIRTTRAATNPTTKVATTDPTLRLDGRLSPEAAGERLSGLFEEHGRMVYGLCRVLLKDADEAQDAAQQVFLSAHRNMLAGTEPREPAAWLATIARNECHGRIRARMATPLALVVDERDAVAADVEHVAEERAEIEALCVALAELPRHQREAIVLREFYGLSYHEVHSALGVTDGAVESLLFRARKRLQAELKPARVASGALALPLALRDSLASAIPGFSSGSSSGGLAKVASLPLLAKLAGAAATLTAAGTIGYAELHARDHDAAVVQRGPEARKYGLGHKAAKPAQLERVSFVHPARTAAAPDLDAEDEVADDNDDLAEGQLAESEGEGEPSELEDTSGDQGVAEPDGDDGGTSGGATEPDGTDDTGGSSGPDTSEGSDTADRASDG
jgi:RNA polymerase sigma factor (sigma-70 family)